MSERQASTMPSVMRLHVPVIVQLASRSMRVGEVLRLAPGTIVELPKSADTELELFVNNRPIGCGRAVKVGEKFGIRLSFLGDVAERLKAVAAGGGSGGTGVVPDSPEALADRLLAGR
ncbi:MAG: FliM/FliN family flagellar motor switch protein [Phycisphaerae bacterium]|nr:FliM/FliN family flagellar motor switch protein [Phycisphaerae bacterium]